jgi:hypothetical protein
MLRTQLLMAGNVVVCGCSSEAEAPTTKDEVRQKQIERGRAMEQEAGR